MKPPICIVCNIKISNREEGGLVYFKKRQSDLEWEKKMEDIGGTGHPPYVEWFCKKHFKQANQLKHLPIEDALEKFTV
jgi:hypothetical protein